MALIMIANRSMKSATKILNHIDDYGFIKISSVFDRQICRGLKDKITKEKGKDFIKV